MTENNELSLESLQQIADQGDTLAQFTLGLYYLPKGVWKNKEGWQFINNRYMQYYCLRFDIESSNEPLINEAFRLIENNHQANTELAFMWFEKAAENGYAEAQYATARCYFDGLGTEVDYKQAFNYATDSQKQSFIESNLLLGNCYAQGKSVS